MIGKVTKPQRKDRGELFTNDKQTALEE